MVLLFYLYINQATLTCKIKYRKISFLLYFVMKTGYRGIEVLLPSREEYLKMSCLFCAKFYWYCLHLLAYIFKKMGSVILLLWYWPADQWVATWSCQRELTDVRQSSFLSVSLSHVNTYTKTFYLHLQLFCYGILHKKLNGQFWREERF